MRMVLCIFGNQNFLSLLYYLDDQLVFMPTEELALERLELVFNTTWNMLAMKFLGHIIDESGVLDDA